MYEIETGLAFTKKNIKVKSFGIKQRDPISGKFLEFDVELEGKLIECKNINWDHLKLLETKASNEIQRYKDSFIVHRRAAQAAGNLFEIYSKRKITDEWKKWLLEKSILFFEEAK